MVESERLRSLTDRELLLGLGLELKAMQSTMSKVETTLEAHDRVLWKGGNGTPALVPSMLSIQKWVKWICGIAGGALATVIAAFVVSAMQKRDLEALLTVQEDIRKYTIEAVRQSVAGREASESAAQSAEESQEILEKKVVPQVTPKLPARPRVVPKSKPVLPKSPPSRPPKAEDDWWPFGG